MMLLPRRYMRGGALAALLAGAAVVISGNRGAFPFGKARWMSRFGEPGPPTDREYALPALAANLTLHVVAHSHSDVGWNRSFGAYYDGSVRLVLRRVVAELWADARRRFTWGDLAFLDMWLSDEGDARHGGMLRGAPEALTWRAAVQALAREGRWAMVGDTYVSPDEGLTTWWAHNAIVDVGHRVLAAQLNATPGGVGWQIDTFGHAATLPYLLANTGHSALVLGRMAFRQQRAMYGALQFLWQGRSSDSALFTHFLSVHYAAPSARFDFDATRECRAPALLAELRRFARAQTRQYPGGHGHVLVMMGDDFRFVHARRAFACLDAVIDYAATRDAADGVRVRYSTPHEYFAAVAPALDRAALHVHAGDFFPYQDKPYEQYWSGVLATRAHLKWLVRAAEQAVQHAEALVAAMRIHAHTQQHSSSSSSSPPFHAYDWPLLERRLEACRKQVAIGYHHDAVTGTCSAQAAADYKRRLRHAARDALRVASAALGLDEGSGAYNTAAHFDIYDKSAAAHFDIFDNSTAAFAKGKPDDALHEEKPDDENPNSLHDEKLDGPAYVTVSNAVAVSNAAALVAQDAVVRVQLASLDAAVVDAATGRPVPADAVGSSADGRPVVEFLARRVPPMGVRAYAVQPGAGRIARVAASSAATARLAKGGVRVELRVVGSHVQITTVSDLDPDRAAVVVRHALRQYFANPLVQASGAYVMHSFMLMYLVVFAVFGAALVLGLAAAVATPRLLLSFIPRPPLATTPLLLAPLLGAACGVAFTHYVAQTADVALLTAWTVGRGLVGLRLAAPAFLAAYAVAAVLRWPARRCVLCVYGVAAGVVLALFCAPTWQSRPIAPAARFDVRLGAVCDSAAIGVGAARVTYRLCADRPALLQVVTAVAAARDREVVAQYELIGGGGLPLWPHQCEFDIFNGVDVVRRKYSRWTPVPGNYYPAVTHVGLAARPLALHLRHSTGVTCIRRDTLELMLHRDMSANDYRGLIDPIDDAAPVTATHFIDISAAGQNGADDSSSVLETNHLVNAPLMAFAVPNATAINVTALVPAPIRNARLVGIQVADPEVSGVAGEPGVLNVLARLQVLPGSHALDLAPADLLRPATTAFAVDGGDWTMAPLSARKRIERRVDRLRVSPTQQTLFRIAIPKHQ